MFGYASLIRLVEMLVDGQKDTTACIKSLKTLIEMQNERIAYLEDRIKAADSGMTYLPPDVR